MIQMLHHLLCTLLEEFLEFLVYKVPFLAFWNSKYHPYRVRYVKYCSSWFEIRATADPGHGDSWHVLVQTPSSLDWQASP